MKNAIRDLRKDVKAVAMDILTIVSCIICLIIWFLWSMFCVAVWTIWTVVVIVQENILIAHKWIKSKVDRLRSIKLTITAVGDVE